MSNFDDYLNDYLKHFNNNYIGDAMTYAIEGGKRLRPRTIFSILDGFDIEQEVAYPAATALEMIHTYSLIHDDLPAMDNDDLRHGKPSLHIAYGESNAILAGDALLTHAFSMVADCSYDNETKVKMISYLSKYSGLGGMIYGQYLDMNVFASDLNKDLLFNIQDNKTGGLFKIACLFAMLLAKQDNEEYYLDLGSLIGLLYQRIDDLSDIKKTEKEMGKTLSDIRNNKPNSLSLYSIEELEELINNTYNQIIDHLANANFETKYLIELIKSVI